MKRRLFNLLAAVSLVLCVATIGLWIRSKRSVDHVWLDTKEPREVWIADGALTIAQDAFQLREISLRGTGRLSVGQSTAVVVKADGTPMTCTGRWSYDHHPTGPISADLPTLFGCRYTWSHNASSVWISPPPSGGPGKKISISGDDWFFSAPLWLLALVTSLLPFKLAMDAARRWQTRTVPGRCRRCDYDLRATPSRCPECGSLPATIT